MSGSVLYIGLTFSSFNMPFISAKVGSSSAKVFYFLCNLTLSPSCLWLLLLWPFSWSLLPIHFTLFSSFDFFTPFPPLILCCECKSVLWHFSSRSYTILYFSNSVKIKIKNFINKINNFKNKNSNSNKITLVLIFSWTFFIFQPLYNIKHITSTVQLIFKNITLFYYLHSSDE